MLKKPILPNVIIPNREIRKIYISVVEPESLTLDFYLVELANKGYTLVHNFDMDLKDRSDFSAETMREMVIKNIDNILKTDVFVCFITSKTYNYPEAFAEIGIAISNKKPVIIVNIGKNRFVEDNIYYYAPGVFKAEDIWDVYNILDKLYNL